MDKHIAIVTGAGRGLGFATGCELARRGYLTVFTARDGVALDQAAGAIPGGTDVRLMPLDITRQADVDALLNFIVKQFGRADVLINNAGILIEGDIDGNLNPSAFTVPPEVVLKTFETNTLGAYRLCQAFLPLMKKNNYGRVVNVSSGMGQLTDMGGAWPAYRISKTALNALTRTFATELDGTNVKVNSVCPGWVRTAMGGRGATRTLEQGIAGIVWAATLADNGPTGGFFRDGKAIEW